MSHDVTLHPIGVIRTPFTDKYSAPRQPGADGEFPVGKIVLEAGENYEQALADLEGFEKIWLIYQFDRNRNWKPKVLPPRSTVKRGVFATRSPHRPNPLGLSLVTLLEIRGRTVTVEGVDMLDKTPIFDIKPYLPGIESFPSARMGWVGESMATVPEEREIVLTPDFLVSIGELAERERTAIVDHVRRMLRFGVRAHPYKRISRDAGDTFTVAYKHWRIGVLLRPDGCVEVYRIAQA